jgi:hypothetical protein
VLRLVLAIIAIACHNLEARQTLPPLVRRNNDTVSLTWRG